MDSLERARELQLVARQMIDLLTEENAALRHHDSSVTRQRSEEKTKLANAYAKLFAGFAKDEDALVELDPEIREGLRETGQRLDALVEENGQLLKIALQSTKTVIDIVAEAARTARPSAGTYGARGTVVDNVRQAPRGVPLAVDKSL